MDKPTTISPLRPYLSLARINAERANTSVETAPIPAPSPLPQSNPSTPSSLPSQLSSSSQFSQWSEEDKLLPELEPYQKKLDELFKLERSLESELSEEFTHTKRMETLLQLLKGYSKSATELFAALKDKDDSLKRKFYNMAHLYNIRAEECCTILLGFTRQERDVTQKMYGFLGDPNLAENLNPMLSAEDEIKAIKLQFTLLELQYRGISDYSTSHDHVERAYGLLKQLQKDLEKVYHKAKEKFQTIAAPSNAANKEAKEESEEEKNRKLFLSIEVILKKFPVMHNKKITTMVGNLITVLGMSARPEDRQDLLNKYLRKISRSSNTIISGILKNGSPSGKSAKRKQVSFSDDPNKNTGEKDKSTHTTSSSRSSSSSSVATSFPLAKIPALIVTNNEHPQSIRSTKKPA